MKKILIPVFLFFCLLPLAAQETGEDRWGIHFQVYGEPHEEGRPLYINILPLVYEHTLGGYMTFKIGTVCGLRIADTVSLGNIGVSAGLPVFPFGMEGRPEGFFIGPSVTASYNLHTAEFVLSTAADIGYSFYMTETLSMSLGGELGFSTFFTTDSSPFILPHYGPAVYLYF